jgi:hypothetical protein
MKKTCAIPKVYFTNDEILPPAQFLKSEVKDSVKDQEKLFELTEGNSYFSWQIKKESQKRPMPKVERK